MPRGSVGRTHKEARIGRCEPCVSTALDKFFGAAKESDAGDAGVQGIGSAVVDVTPGDDFELIAHQTSASTKKVAADELTWFAIGGGWSSEVPPAAAS